MSALDLKLLRDLWRMRGQAFAIALVLAAAVATFVLSMGVYRSLIETRDAYYARNHFADVFVEMTRAPRSIVERVNEIPGVQRAEGSIQQYATLDFPDSTVPVRALINSVSEYGHTRLNEVTLRSGHMPRPGNTDEVVVDEAFANANALTLGSEVDALIYGSKERLRIVGIGLAPNYLYAIAPGDIIPDESRFGIFWMGEKALEAATDRTEAINTISLTLGKNASEADVVRKLDSLLAPYGGTGGYGREDHLSHAFLDSDLKGLSAMTQVIPPVFLLVSTFLVYVVLGRMIRTERTQIGLIKAFGYSDWAIGWHYLKFALVIAVLAILMGSIAGTWMGGGVTAIYGEYYRFPFLYYRISSDVFLGGAAMSAGAAALGALAGVRSAVSLNPAVAMSPPPPPVYRAGFVERLGQIAGFSAIGHMIVRHIARWPGRSAITVVGVALSIGLLFSVIQFLDSARVMLDIAFFRAQRQDMTVSFTEPQNNRAIHDLAKIEGVLRVERARAIPVKMSHGNRVERTAIESTNSGTHLTAKIDSDGQEIQLPPAGLMLSRQLADQLDVKTGDSVFIEQLGGRRTKTYQRVSAIFDDLLGTRAYAAETTLDAIARDATLAGSANLRIDSAARDQILTELNEMPVVLGVVERDAALEKFEEMIDENIFTMLFFYIFFASAIAVGVVYNSARILFSERAHELATLRVLGYHRSEVGIVLLGELALLVVVSVPFGCLIGYWLAQLMTAMFSTDLFRMPFAPDRSTYAYSALIVLAAAALTALIVARRVIGLDMVRVLKARD